MTSVACPLLPLGSRRGQGATADTATKLPRQSIMYAGTMDYFWKTEKALEGWDAAAAVIRQSPH